MSAIVVSSFGLQDGLEDNQDVHYVGCLNVHVPAADHEVSVNHNGYTYDTKSKIKSQSPVQAFWTMLVQVSWELI